MRKWQTGGSKVKFTVAAGFSTSGQRQPTCWPDRQSSEKNLNHEYREVSMSISRWVHYKTAEEGAREDQFAPARSPTGTMEHIKK